MVYTIIAVAVLVVLLYFVITGQEVFGAEAKGERLKRMQQSAHYRDGQFQNLSETPSLAEGYSMPKVMFDFFLRKNPLLKPSKIFLPFIQI
jgi:hypothetical protein